MNELTAILLTKALDGLSMRATAISQNIANANTPSYSPVRVSFEEDLRAAALQDVNAARSVEPKLSYALSDTTNPELRLDLEMASASQTALRYSALVDVFNRQMQLTRLVARGGQ